jgi:hypothetical protein
MTSPPLTLPAMIDTFDLRDDAEGDDGGCKDSDAETEFAEAKDVVIGRGDCNAEGVDATEESGCVKIPLPWGLAYHASVSNRLRICHG